MLPEIIVMIAQALWFVAPAWAANAFPPLTGGKMPLDRGLTIHGKRLFGDSKTIEGTIGGLIFGLFIGWLLMLSQSSFPAELWKDLMLFDMTLPIIILITVGALFGDIIGSAIKRRINLAPGARFWPFDQIGFIIFAIIFVAPLFVLSLGAIVIAILLTLFIHWFGNILGYAMHVKNVPW